MTDKFDIAAEYERLQKKFKLPDFETFNKEFELTSIDKKELLTRTIRRKMRDKLVFFCRIIEGILYPTERSPLATYESAFFDEETKKELSSMHRTMMVLERQSLLLDIEDSEEKNVAYMLELWQHWKPFKEQLNKTVVTMTEAWKSAAEEQTQEGYFG